MDLRFYNFIDLIVLAKKTPLKKNKSNSDESSSDEEEAKSKATAINCTKTIGGKGKIKVNHILHEIFIQK